MGRDATKAAGNPWYQARKKAAEYDDRLCSRESAAEQLGMSVSSLADAELGNTKFMPVDKAVLMADRYNAPWLLNHYCLNECPIGCRHSLSDEVVGIDRVTVKLLKSLKTEQLGEVKDTLLDIAADGKITEDEKPALQEVLTYQNIRSGVFILSDLYGKYGDWHKALICYNYGEGGAQEHVFSKGYENSPVKKWNDSLSGEETDAITPEEYQQLAEEFIGARPVKNKEDETNGKDP